MSIKLDVVGGIRVWEELVEISPARCCLFCRRRISETTNWKGALQSMELHRKCMRWNYVSIWFLIDAWLFCHINYCEWLWMHLGIHGWTCIEWDRAKSSLWGPSMCDKLIHLRWTPVYRQRYGYSLFTREPEYHHCIVTCEQKFMSLLFNCKLPCYHMIKKERDNILIW